MYLSATASSACGPAAACARVGSSELLCSEARFAHLRARGRTEDGSNLCGRLTGWEERAPPRYAPPVSHHHVGVGGIVAIHTSSHGSLA